MLPDSLTAFEAQVFSDLQPQNTSIPKKDLPLSETHNTYVQRYIL